MTAQKPYGHRLWRFVLAVLCVVLALGLAVLTPWNVSGLESHPRPAQSYAEAVQRVAALWGQAGAEMNPLCRPELLTHGKKVERAIILVHGYTNCPQQFRELGRRFYDLGYNVLIAPLPHHGLADRMTDAQAQLRAEELAAYADATVDVAQGLGQHVTMMGISAGGTTTAWAAQHRSDIDVAVIISPAFGFKQIPTPMTAAVMNVETLLPDSFQWWDPVRQADAPPPYAYPRYFTHPLTQILRLGFATQADAQRAQPAAKKVVVVFNANDNSVNNSMTMTVVKNWQARGANVSTYEFEAALKLGHDLIDPTQADEQIEVVYPRLIELARQ